jgi:hypothetical protein
MSTHYRHLLFLSVQVFLIAIFFIQDNGKVGASFDSRSLESAQVVNTQLPATTKAIVSLACQYPELPINSDSPTPGSRMEVLDTEEQFSVEDEFITTSNLFHLICSQHIEWPETPSQALDELLLTTTQPPDHTL